MVYPNGQQPPPRLVFVCPAERRDHAFRSALDRLGIRLVTFTTGKGGGVSFFGLNRALKGIMSIAPA